MLGKSLRRLQTTSTLSEIPSGTFIKTEKGHFYVQSNTKRLRFATARCLNSWSPQRVVELSEQDAAVKKLRIVAKMKFRNGSLLYSQSDGKMYLISENKRRHIVNPDWLNHLNVKRADIPWVSLDEINLHEEGEPLS